MADIKRLACTIGKPKKRWYPVALEGTWKGHANGAFTLDTRALEQVRINFDTLGLDVVVDYEHQTLSGAEAPAAGWIKHPGGLKVKDGELLARIEWTPRAKEQIDAGEYRYLSPVLSPHDVDPKSGEDVGWVLHSVALTNTPFLAELPPIAAKTDLHPNKETTMPKPEDALKTENEQLKQQLADIQSELETHRKNAAAAQVKEAIAARKLSPDQEEWGVTYALKDPEGFTTFLAKAKPVMDKPDDDLYAASRGAGSTKDMLDVVAMAVGGAA